MGVHSGPVSGVIDVNRHANLAGADLNIAQRVMGCGDAGHILFSKHVAEDLEAYEQWHPLCQILGPAALSIGIRISSVALSGEEWGSPGRPKKSRPRKNTTRESARPEVSQ